MSVRSERPQKDLGCLLYHIYIIYMSSVIFLGAGSLTRLVVRKSRYPPVSAAHSAVLYVCMNPNSCAPVTQRSESFGEQNMAFVLPPCGNRESSSGRQVRQQVPLPAEPSPGSPATFSVL